MELLDCLLLQQLLLLLLLLLSRFDLLLQLQLLLLVGRHHGLDVEYGRLVDLSSRIHEHHFSAGGNHLLHLLRLADLRLSRGDFGRFDLDRTGRAHRLLLGAHLAALGQQVLLRLHGLRGRRWPYRGSSLR